LEFYQTALQAVNGSQAVAASLQRLPLGGRQSLVAVGKAAQAMAQGAWEVLGDQICRALLISKQGHLDQPACRSRGWESMEAGHPLPDQGSLLAGQRLLDFLQQDTSSGVLFLISGGASSLVECPIPGVDPIFLRRANDWLLSSGLAIDQMNQVRKGLSRIKGGGLLQWLESRTLHALAISDVPDDDPAVIGSGLLVPDPGLWADLQRIPLPDWLAGPVYQGLAQRQPSHVAAPAVEIVANLELAKQVAAQQARARGYAVRLMPEFIAGDAETQGRHLASEVLQSQPGVTIWGGEPTVRLPAHPGHGGRNQHLALAAAQTLQTEKRVWFLAAGTDGSDGNTADAGALVDGSTVRRAAMEGLDANQALAEADAGSLLEVTGDLITTGPTGTSVMDLMIGLKL
jgi:hydroxypyruvate reductase